MCCNETAIHSPVMNFGFNPPEGILCVATNEIDRIYRENPSFNPPEGIIGAATESGGCSLPS